MKKIVMNVPHSSIEGINNSGWSRSLKFFDAVKSLTDWHTDFIFDFAGSGCPVDIVRSGLSRFVCDVERLENDPMESIGQGIIYTKYDDTLHGGFRRVVSAESRKNLMAYYHAHINRLRNCLTPDALLVDFHSFPSFKAKDVDICIGYNEDWSRPSDSLIGFVEEEFRKRGYTVGINNPYSNSISPETGFCYPSIMIELNKQIYMDEQTLQMRPDVELISHTMEHIFNEVTH